MNSSGERFTDERLCAALRALPAATPKAVVGAVRQRLDAFVAAAPKADDVTLLALRWQPE